MSRPSVRFMRLGLASAVSQNVGIATNDAAQNRISSSYIGEAGCGCGRSTGADALIQRCCQCRCRPHYAASAASSTPQHQSRFVLLSSKQHFCSALSQNLSCLSCLQLTDAGLEILDDLRALRPIIHWAALTRFCTNYNICKVNARFFSLKSSDCF